MGIPIEKDVLKSHPIKSGCMLPTRQIASQERPEDVPKEIRSSVLGLASMNFKITKIVSTAQLVDHTKRGNMSQMSCIE